MRYLLAQAATAVTGTNAPTASVLQPSSDMVERIASSTGLPPTIVHWGSVIGAGLVVLVIGFWVANILRATIQRVCAKKNLDLTISGFVGNLAHAAAMTFVVITVLGVLGVPTASFAAVIAAAGLAIGLALQGSLSNFAAGFLLIVFRPFKKGDVVSGAGAEGTVEEISIFSTALTTVDNKRIIVPNSGLMGGNITNFTANPTRRVDLQFGIGAGQDVSKAHATLIAVAQAEARILKDPAPAVVNVKFIDNGILIELRSWCKTADWAQLGSDLLVRCPAALAEAGIRAPDRTISYREVK